MVKRSMLICFLFAFIGLQAMEGPLLGPDARDAGNIASELYDMVKNNNVAALQCYFEHHKTFDKQLVLVAHDSHGLTPLHWAAFWGSYEVAQWMLLNVFYVNPRGKNIYGYTQLDAYEPIHLAAMAGSVAQEDLFLPCDRNTDHTRPTAPCATYVNMIKLFKKMGASVNTCHQSWKSPLWIACCTAKSYEIAVALMECGAQFYEWDPLTNAYLPDHMEDGALKDRLCAKAKSLGQRKMKICSIL